MSEIMRDLAIKSLQRNDLLTLPEVLNKIDLDEPVFAIIRPEVAYRLAYEPVLKVRTIDQATDFSEWLYRYWLDHYELDLTVFGKFDYVVELEFETGCYIYPNTVIACYFIEK